MFDTSPASAADQDRDSRSEPRADQIAAPGVPARGAAARVQLVLYPDGDSAFASSHDVTQIDLPDHYNPEQVIEAIQKHLRVSYPSATIQVEPSDHGDYEATWHVHRDGDSTAIEQPATPRASRESAARSRLRRVGHGTTSTANSCTHPLTGSTFEPATARPG